MIGAFGIYLMSVHQPLWSVLVPIFLLIAMSFADDVGIFQRDGGFWRTLLLRQFSSTGDWDSPLWILSLSW